MANEHTRQQIVEVAKTLFATEGVRAVTMDGIAQQMHISKRTLYEHFDNKEQLLQTCLAEVHKEMRAIADYIIGQTKQPVIMAFFVVKNIIDSQTRYFRLLHDAKQYYPEIHYAFIQEIHQRFFGDLRHVLQEAQREGTLRSDLDVDRVAKIVSSRMGRQVPVMNEEELPMEDVNAICYTFIRGMMSIKAIAEYEEHKEQLRAELEQHARDYMEKHQKQAMLY